MNKEKLSIPEDENEKIKLMRIEIISPFILFIMGVIYSSQIKSLSEATNFSVPTLRQLFFLSIILIYGTIIKNQKQKIKDIEKKLGK